MKKLLLGVAIIATSFTGFAQVGVGTPTPDASSVLEVKSTTKGFLPPRMTQIQMDAISSPTEGLIVYCTNCTPKGFYYHDGSDFVSFSNQVTFSTIDIRSRTERIWMHYNLRAPQATILSLDGATYVGLY